MNIAVISSEEKDGYLYYTGETCRRLLKLGVRVLVPEQNRAILGLDGVLYMAPDEIFRQADLVVTIGGDGTILHAARNALERQTPVLGINTGRVGFMAALEVNELDKLSRLVTGDFDIDSRLTLEIRVSGSDEIHYALNDAVISKGAISKTIDVHLACDGMSVTHYRADGLIVSTPTGSTAYALSAGGPVIDPRIACIGVTPVCSHSLISRPMVFEADAKLSVTPSHLSGKNAYLTIDGLHIIQLGAGVTVHIARSPLQTRLVRLRDISFFEVFFHKMNEK